ncbi:unnamed protein product [Polarella glacialis]|uniref:EF-hand domain-containing protein n=1 Tax=Polarella glacialis TaxID=89957 RepID=A0A813H1S6_POLGL|nr:unnamed protein product [Polarella glacialis]
MDLIDENGSGALEMDEARSVLNMMGVHTEEAQDVLRIVFQDSKQASIQAMMDVLIGKNLRTVDELESMLSRIEMFQKAFRSVDVDGSGKIDLKEIFLLMDHLNVDRGLAAEVMSFMDDDGSGEVTWFEFIESITSDEFQAAFPSITLEALSLIPSCVDLNPLHRIAKQSWFYWFGESAWTFGY